MNRRSFYRYGSVALGSAVGLVLAIPGVRYLIDPLHRKAKSSGARQLTTLSQLKVGIPQSFPIMDEREDAWVKYPKEPVGSVWLVRQTDNKVLAFTAECPHLGCAVGLSGDRKEFFCPCHQARFGFDGATRNNIAQRGMDPLPVEMTEDADPLIKVTFERFRTQSKERKPLV